jgi:hypothetical protein
MMANKMMANKMIRKVRVTINSISCSFPMIKSTADNKGTYRRIIQKSRCSDFGEYSVVLALN